MRGGAEKNAGCAKDMADSGERTEKGVEVFAKTKGNSHMQGFTEKERGVFCERAWWNFGLTCFAMIYRQFR